MAGAPYWRLDHGAAEGGAGTAGGGRSESGGRAKRCEQPGGVGKMLEARPELLYKNAASGCLAFTATCMLRLQNSNPLRACGLCRKLKQLQPPAPN